MSDRAPRLAELLPALRRGDGEAIAEVYDLTAEGLLTFAAARLRDDGAAEDVVQETFVAFVRHADRLRAAHGEAVLAWLYTTARRRCLDRHRRRGRRGEVLVAAPVDGPAAPPTSARLRDPELLDALDALPEAQREAVLLRRIVGLDGDEVAAVLGIDREAVYARCARGERRLRELLAPSDGDVVARRKGETT